MSVAGPALNGTAAIVLGYTSDNSKSGIVDYDGDPGFSYINFKTIQTNALAAGRYVNDVEMTSSGGGVTRVLEGQVEVTPGVTR